MQHKERIYYTSAPRRRSQKFRSTSNVVPAGTTISAMHRKNANCIPSQVSIISKTNISSNKIAKRQIESSIYPQKVEDAKADIIMTRRAGHTRKKQQPLNVNEANLLKAKIEKLSTTNQEQNDEIIALRALAKSLTEEVRGLQRNNICSNTSKTSYTTGYARRNYSTTYVDPNPNLDDESTRTEITTPQSQQSNKSSYHEFFRLDEEMNHLYKRNLHLEKMLKDREELIKDLHQITSTEIPQYKLEIVKAFAELESLRSQLKDEQEHSETLCLQIAYYKARTSARINRPEHIKPKLKGGYKTNPDDFSNTGNSRRSKNDYLDECLNDFSEDPKQHHKEENNDDVSVWKKNLSASTAITHEISSSASKLEALKPSNIPNIAENSGSGTTLIKPKSAINELLSPSKAIASQIKSDLAVLNKELQRLHYALDNSTVYNRSP